MAILFAEDFKGYGDQKDLLLNGLWGTSGLALVPDPDPNAAGRVARFAAFGNGARRPFAKGALATAGVAYRLWLDTLPNFTTHNARFLDGASVCQCCLAFTPTGVAQIWTGVIGHGGTMLGQTPAPVMTATAWHHVEFKVVCDIAAGSAEVRIDGISVLTVNNVNTGVALQLGLGTTDDYSNTAGVNCQVKDLVVWDGTGARNNAFLGTVSVLSLWPDRDISLGWTPSTGATGYNLVNQAPPTDGVDYITAPYPPPPPSTMNLSDLPPFVTSVRGLITQVRARKSDGGDGNMQVGIISQATEIDGANRPLTTAFTYYEDVFETDPATGGAWSVPNTNAAIIDLNRTA